jgi:hypothetical protein
MLALHCHASSYTTMLGFTEALKNVSSLSYRDAAIWTPSSISCAVTKLKRTHFFIVFLLRYSRKKNQGDSGLVDDLARIQVPAFLSISQCRESQVNFWTHSWNGLRQHRACTTRFVGTFSGTVSNNFDRMCSKKFQWAAPLSLWGKTYGPMKQFSQNTSPGINWELLLMSCLIVLCGFTSLQMCLLWKLVCRSCEAIFVSEEYKTAKEGIFTATSKEQMAKFLAWAKIERTGGCTRCK